MSDLLIVSLSARALVASAVKAGFDVYAIDLFNDIDTCSLSTQYARAKLHGCGFAAADLLATIERLDPQAERTLLLGSGFENQAPLLNALAQQRTVLGCKSTTVAQVKNPWQLATLLAQLAIPHPSVRRSKPQARGWLAKKIGHCGGAHVIWADTESTSSADTYYQRYVDGRLLSATILSNSYETRILGYAEQWCAVQQAEQLFMHGGGCALNADTLPRCLRNNIEAAVAALAKTCALLGLWNIDFVINEQQWWLLEINPRPGATFELHEHYTSLVAEHIKASQGNALSPINPYPAVYKAHDIVYARQSIIVPDAIWPDWVSDRPQPGTRIEAYQPACVIHAQSASSQAARALLAERQQQLLELFKSWQTVQ